MVDVNPNASTVQAQLQAQLQAGKNNARPSDSNQAQRPKDVIEERIQARRDESGTSRQLPVKRSTRNVDLSSPQELDAAKARVSDVAGNNREAPVGRTSARQNELRSQPLGQIIDIRV
jgi:uncharacterized membrane protein